MNYIEISTGKYPVTEREIRRAYPNISFPKEFVAPDGYAEVESATALETNDFQILRELSPVFENGVYHQVFEVSDIPLDDAKELKTSEIKHAFDKEFRDGKVESSLGFVTDCRRSDTKNDRENLQLRIDAGIFPINWKDAEGIDHPLTEVEAKKLSSEMGAEVLKRFEKKWSLQKSIEDATNVSQLQEIRW